MKKIFRFLPYTILCLPLLSGTCKKDDLPAPGPGPSVTLITTGYLCTKGINRDGHGDTLTFHFSTSGGDLVPYIPGLTATEDKVTMDNNGNGTMSIKKLTPYVQNNKSFKWFGIQVNVNPSVSEWPNNKYLFTMFHEDPSEETQFIIKRNKDDMEKFSIESKADPGYFLGCAKWKNATYPTTNYLVFTSKEQEFWFRTQ